MYVFTFTLCSKSQGSDYLCGIMITDISVINV